jgi:2-dehydropantoate 2-reductase
LGEAGFSRAGRTSQGVISAFFEFFWIRPSLIANGRKNAGPYAAHTLKMEHWILSGARVALRWRDKSKMRIAIMGAGALGSYFGARLTACGADVALIGRGAHLSAMQTQGLRVDSPKGDVHVLVNAASDPADIGPVDCILLFVKTYDVAQACADMAPMIGPQTFIVPFQNGVTAPGIVAQICGAGRVLPGLARIPAGIKAPGVVEHRSSVDTLVFGPIDPLDAASMANAKALHQALEAAGTTPLISADITRDLWKKFILQSATSAICALTRADFGTILSDPQSAALISRAMDETAAVGRAEHPDFPPDMAALAYEALKAFPGSVRASMLDDLERGKRLELPDISGEVARLGRKHGIKTPVHDVALGALSLYVQGRPKP